MTGFTVSAYVHQTHMYYNEIWTRNYDLVQSGILSSHCYVAERWAFGFRLLPYHQSIEFVNPKTSEIRHVGLGKIH